MHGPDMKVPSKTSMIAKDKNDSPDEFGENSTLGRISKHMEPSAFGILLDLIGWARVWDGSYAASETGTVILKFDDALVRALLTPFKGFGNNARLYAVVSEKVVALIGREVPLWLGDPAYRKANSMVWCVLQSIAPSLAVNSHGYDGQMAIVAILAEGFKDD